MCTNVQLNICFYCWCSVAKSCWTLHEPMDCSTPGFPVLHCLHYLHSLKLMSTESVMPSNHLILCRPLHLLLSTLPSIRVFSNKSAVCIRWPKYWSFSFCFRVSPSKEYLGLISFRIDWFDLLAFQGTLQESSPAPGTLCAMTEDLHGIKPQRCWPWDSPNIKLWQALQPQAQFR